MPSTPQENAAERPCCVCGSPARYGSTLPVCGPGCDQVLGTPEDPIPITIALIVVSAVVAIIVWSVLS